MATLFNVYTLLYTFYTPKSSVSYTLVRLKRKVIFGIIYGKILGMGISEGCFIFDFASLPDHKDVSKYMSMCN